MEAAVPAPEELVAAADRQHRGTAGDRLPQLLRLRGHVLGNQELLAVLPAADVEEVVGARPQRLAHADRLHLEPVAAPLGPPGQDRDVPAVGVDVEVVRIQMADADVHAARSQYGRVKPRPATIFRRPSIAV